MRCDDKSGGAPQAAVGKRRRPVRTIGQATQERIGLHLQTMYQRVLSQPVPDRFVDLIGRLEADARSMRDGGPPSATRRDDAPKTARPPPREPIS